ncbi:MAG TPA: hypothetical protein VFN64_00845 [Burkholderiaceae bacterium]|nr:hypothetical protein [Burkholderiaceae bacterium]
MKKNCGLITATLLLAGCGSVSVPQPSSPARDLSRYAYTRIACTPDNESHFDTVTIELAKVDAVPPAPPFFAKGSQASRAVFAAFEAGWGSQDLKARKFHPAPAPQYVVFLDGLMSVTTSDGETRQFKPGDVLRVEDTSPCKGHISVVGERPASTLVVR